MNRYLEAIQSELSQQRILRPLIMTNRALQPLAEHLSRQFPKAAMVKPGQATLMGRDVILLHSGEQGWDDLLEEVCQQSPGRLFVIAPECPRTESLKLEWVADVVIVGKETHQYEVHELGLSA